MKWIAMESATVVIVVGPPQLSCRWLVGLQARVVCTNKSTSRKGAPKILSAWSGREEEEEV
jgi:hypothetical protein